MKELEKLVEEKKMEDLVIDLRGNPGGYLQETTQILSQLFQDGERLLVYTEGRTSPRKEFDSTGRPFFKVGRIVVLVDDGSASASEILAGAVQDNDRGIVVGRRSFGKGLVQERYTLSDGSEIHLTVARYFTPSGRSIQKSYLDKDEYRKDVSDRYSNGELLNADSIKVVDSTAYYTTSGRRVYGGGGITPDVFVPLDTQYLNNSYLVYRNQIPAFIFRFLEKEEAAFAEMSAESFINQYRISDETWEYFLSFVENRLETFEADPDELAIVVNQLQLEIKARIGRQMFGPEVAYSISYSNDADVQKAIELIGSPDTQWRASIE